MLSGPAERTGRPVTDGESRTLAVPARTPEVAVAVPRGPRPVKARSAARARPLRMEVRAGLLVQRRVVLGRQARLAAPRPPAGPAPASSAAARGRPRTMTCVAAPGLRRAAVPAGQAGLRPAGREPTADATGMADATAGRPLVTTGLLRRVTEPAARSARTEPRGGTERPGPAVQPPASTGAGRDPRVRSRLAPPFSPGQPCG